MSCDYSISPHSFPGLGAMRADDTPVNLQELDRLSRDELETLVRELAEREKRAAHREDLAERNLRLALKESPIVLARMDRELRYQWVFNGQPQFKNERIIGKKGEDLFDNDDELRRLTQAKRQVLQTGEPVSDEFVLGLQGKRRHYHFTIEPFYNTSGRIDGASSAVVDITPYKQTQAQLEGTSLRLTLALNAARQGMWEYDIENKTIIANQRCLEIMGLNQEPILGFEAFLENVIEKDRDEAIKAFGQAIDLNSGDTIATRLRVSAKENDLRWVEVNGKSYFEMAAGGRRHPMIFVGVAQDVTEHVMAELRAEAVNERLSLLVSQRDSAVKAFREITRMADTAVSVSSILAQALKIICRRMEWPLGVAYQTEPGKDNEVRSVAIFSSDVAGEDVFEQSALHKEPISMDWEIVRRAVTDNKTQVSHVPDKELPGAAGRVADALGMKSAWVVPVAAHEEAAGLFLFFSRKENPSTDDFLRLITDLSLQVGQAIVHYQTERQLAEAIRTEQQKLGQELHDTLGQELTGLTMSARSLYNALKKRDEASAEKAAAISSLLQNANDTARNIAKGVYPVDVTASTLLPALEKLLGAAQEQYGFQSASRLDYNPGILDDSQAIEIYRIAQEAMKNAGRHARARRLEMELTVNTEECQLAISDDGKGFSENAVGFSSGIGIKIMRHRARTAGMDFEIIKNEKGGVTVRCFRDK